jgi:signal transduction histidine kinase
MTTRNRPIRTGILTLTAVPLLALLAFGIPAATLAAGHAVHLLSARTLVDTVAEPGAALVAELQRERRLSVEFLATPDSSPSALAAQRAGTDRAIAAFRRAAGAGDATVRAGIRQVAGDLDRLAAARGPIDRRQVGAVAAQRQYDTVIDTALRLVAVATAPGDGDLDRQAGALAAVAHGQEYLSRADSLLAGAQAAGRFPEDVRVELLRVLGTAHFLLTDGVRDLPASDRTAYQRLTAGAAVRDLTRLQDTLYAQSRTGAPAPVPSTSWQPAYDTSAQQLQAFQLNGTEALAARAHSAAVGTLVRLAVAGAAGLLALVVAILLAVRTGRSIGGRLARMRGEVLEVANERLPAVAGRLHRGEAVDIAVETPPLDYGRDEIGQVAHAVNQVQHSAVQTAVEQARARRGLTAVYLNIARRSQSLLHRQLALLDRMERHETTPDKLEDLYRVDHLATRMRRHAEDLVILAGAAPGRGWRHPVPIVDVLRGAISEVEDYKRIDIRSVEPSAVLGRAVGDIIHLLAELLENAVAFAPPETRVEVTGQVLPSGYALEIEDRGRGMSPEAVREANRKLSEPQFDPDDSGRLGLFLVAQLAGRHGIRIELRPSAPVGITAIVLIPGDLVTVNAEPTALPPGPAVADPARERPLVGSGTDDPSRPSLAALQWNGAEPLRTVPAPSRPAARNGGGPARADATPRQRSANGGGPAPADAIPRQRADTGAPDPLPRRVRQASLAPQLRDPVPDPPADAPSRTPDQARTLLTALQQGTERGRRAARGAQPAAEGAVPMADAPTVIFPSVPDRP